MARRREAATIRDVKDRRQRAAKLNFSSVAERCDKDEQLKLRMMQGGRAMEDMQKFDYLSYAVLPDPGRSEEQRHCRAGSHYTSDGLFNFGIGPAKLVFYAHCEVEPLRSLKLIDETSDAPIGLTYIVDGRIPQPWPLLRDRCGPSQYQEDPHD